MKSIRNIALSALLTIGAFSAVTYTSCTKDECKDVVCANGGTCTDGSCTCATGYEGTLCATVSATKFIGTWNVSEPACGGSYTNTISIGTSATSVAFQNLGNFSSPAQVIASADKNTLTFTNVTDGSGRKFTGTGTISGTTLTVNYTVTYTDLTTDACVAVFTK